MPKNIPPNKQQRALQSVRRRYTMHARHDIKRSAAARRTPHTRPASPPRTPRTPKSPTSIEPRRKRTWLKRILFFLVLLALISGGVFGYKIIAAGDKISAADRSILGQLKDLLFSQGEFLAGEQDGRINILLIAIGGEGHKGEDLADTIMLASIDPQTNQAALLSIPRDLYVQVPGEEYYSKINSVHAYGESQKKDRGPQLLTELVQEISGLPIHYYLRVDFTAFKSIIDSIGGINITIENSFYDYWHKISFPTGTERMNGERALAFVRARYIEGPEGGDFKRAARQQQVILALREKVFSVQTALDFGRVNSILNSLSDNIRTDMQLWEMKRAFEMARLINPDLVNSNVLTTGPRGVLVGGTEMLGGTPASILKPRTGDYSEIQSIAKHMLDTAPQTPEAIESPEATEAPETIESPEATEAPETIQPTPEPLTVEIRNGTTVNGLAKKTSDSLTADGYDVTAIGNAGVKNLTASTVYILNASQASAAESLAASLAASTSTNLPESEPASSADALLIIGQDLAE